MGQGALKCVKCLKWWVHWGPWYVFTCVMRLQRSCLHWDSYGVGVPMGSDMHPAHALGLLLAINLATPFSAKSIGAVLQTELARGDG